MRPGLRKGVYGIEAGEQSAANGAKEYRAHKPKGSEGRTVRSADAGRRDTAQAHIIHFLTTLNATVVQRHLLDLLR